MNEWFVWANVIQLDNCCWFVMTCIGLRMALWLYVFIKSAPPVCSAVKTLKESQIPLRKEWTTKLWKLLLRRWKSVNLAELLCDLVSCDPYILSKGRVMVEWGLAHLSVSMHMNENANSWRLGYVKAFSETKAHPRGSGAECLASAHQGRVPSARITARPSTFSSRQNTWLLMLNRANDKRQMCPPRRIHFDKLLLCKLLKQWNEKPQRALFYMRMEMPGNRTLSRWLCSGCKCQFHVRYRLYSSMTFVIASSLCIRMEQNECWPFRVLRLL